MAADLSDVTLVCIDCAQPALALAAMHRSLAQARFGAAVLLTDAPIADAQVEVRRIAPIGDARAYSAFVLKQLAAHVTGDFALVMQWDGWVLDGTRWEDGFRAFDYIGAPWPRARPGADVGNGGFSLRSRRLLDLLAQPDFPVGHPEDARIGATWRPALEQRGIRFPAPGLARRFSVEMDIDPAPSFGFHGLYNFWRAIAPAELPALIATIPPARMRDWPAQDLLLRYVTLQRWAEAEIVRRRIDAEMGEPALEAALSAFLGAGQGEATLAAIKARQ